MAEANVAVLIDYENVGLDSVQSLLDQTSDVGRVIIKRAYADWSVHRGKRDQLLELGIEAKHLFHATNSGKNSSDISLVIDAVDLLYVAPVDTFVIVSSDSDFVPLVSKLRAAGKGVIGAGRRDVSSPTLVKSCDRYIYFDEPRATDNRRGRPTTRKTQPASLLVRALEASIDDRGQVLGSKLHQTMQRIDPSFSFKDLGHGTFTHFLSSSQEVSISHPEDASDVIVQLNHSQAHEARGSSEGTNAGALNPDWERAIDAAWTGRQRSRLSGQAAAADAARVLGVSGLRMSKYPSLARLLDASPILRANWRRDGNAIIRR